MTGYVRHPRLRLFALERARVLARLRVMLAGEERPEEAAAGLQSTAAVGTPLVGNSREIVRLGDEVGELHVLERLVERLPEVAEHALPAEVTILDLVELQLHLGGESDVEDVGELLHHHALDLVAELGREEASLLERHVPPVGEPADDAGVRAGSPDAKPLQLLHETGLRETRRRLGEMLRRRDAVDRHLLSDLADGQRLLVFQRLRVAFFARFAIQRKAALELDDAAGAEEQTGS